MPNFRAGGSRFLVKALTVAGWIVGGAVVFVPSFFAFQWALPYLIQSQLNTLLAAVAAGYVTVFLLPNLAHLFGVGMPYALTVSIFGGTAPAVALAFKQAGHESWFYYYLSGMIFISLVVYALMRDTKTHSAMATVSHP